MQSQVVATTGQMGNLSISSVQPEQGQSIVSMGEPFGAPVETMLRVNQHVSFFLTNPTACCG